MLVPERCVFHICHTGVITDLLRSRYLRDLQNEVKQLKRLLSAKPSKDFPYDLGSGKDGGVNSEDGFVPSEISSTRLDERQILQTDHSTYSIWTSPFTLPTTVIMDMRRPSKPNKRNWSMCTPRFQPAFNLPTDTTCTVWLAPASPWSFTARLTFMMTERLGLDLETASSQGYLDGDIYPLTWNGQTACGITVDLPSLEYALHLYNVAKLHLGQRYRFLDEEAFMARMTSFYNDPPEEKSTGPRMWFVQFLLILAFGKAFVSRPNGNNPPGSKFFLRAMSIMPSNTTTGKDSLMVIEALALAALYLYSVDHRESSHLHVSTLIIRSLLANYSRDV